MSKALELINYIVPEVRAPKYKLTLMEKLKWTGLVLLLFYFMSAIPLYGVSQTVKTRFSEIFVIFGASFGTLMTLGIGPIITGVIVLELLIGGEIIKLDLSKDEDRKKFRYLYKLFALLFVIYESAVFVFHGMLPLDHPSIGLAILVWLQLIAAGIILLLMDDLVGKWGIGSGISLFILAGTSKAIFAQIFSPLPVGTEEKVPAGHLLQLLYWLVKGNLFMVVINLLPLIAFAIVFIITVVGQGIKIELPFTFTRFRGQSIRYPISLLFVSNIPVIFAAILLANVEAWALAAWKAGKTFLGTFKEVETPYGTARYVPASGLVYYLSPQPLYSVLTGEITLSQWAVPAFFYTLAMVLLSIVFARFWIAFAPGMSPKSIAEQLYEMGMAIPGHRASKRVMEKILKKYITRIAELGGIIVGFIAALASILGSAIGGTSILLAVLIAVQYYEALRKQHPDEVEYLLRKLNVIREKY